MTICLPDLKYVCFFFSICTQVIGSLFAPSQKSKKLSHHFRVCLELVFGILNAPRKIFLAVYEPILKLQGLQGVRFQGKIELKLRAKLIIFLGFVRPELISEKFETVFVTQFLP